MRWGNETVDIVKLAPSKQGQLHDILTEIQRFEREMWGNPVDAAIMRCLAATRLKCSRPARITEIANALNLGVATVHARLARLKRDGPAQGCCTGPAVFRTEGGYAETSAGRELNARCARRIAELVARLDLDAADLPPAERSINSTSSITSTRRT